MLTVEYEGSSVCNGSRITLAESFKSSWLNRLDGYYVGSDRSLRESIVRNINFYYEGDS